MYKICGMRGHGSGVGCSVVEWVKRSTLRWFCHTEGMEDEEFVKVYLSSVEGPNRRGRPLGRWEGKVRYVSEMGVEGMEGRGGKDEGGRATGFMALGPYSENA